MNARDELVEVIAADSNYERDGAGWGLVAGLAADAVIAEGYVKTPSREAIMRVLRRKRTRGNTSADGDSGATADLILALLAGETS